MLRIATERQRRAGIARRQLEEVAVRRRREVARSGTLARTVAREIRVVAIRVGDAAIEIAVAGHRPLPLRLGLAVKGEAEMRAVARHLARERFEQRPVEADQ